MKIPEKLHVLMKYGNPCIEEFKDHSGLQSLLFKENWCSLFALAEKNRLIFPFCQNVLSLEEIPEKVKKEASQLLSNEIRDLNNLKETLQMISAAFKREKVRFVIMKTLRRYTCSPADIDLIVNEEDVEKVLGILEKLDYHIYRAAVPYEPYKVACISKHSYVDIDIYPKIAWRRLTYISEKHVLRRRRSICCTGAELYLPSDEDELLIICAHTFSHCRTTLGDIFHLILTLNKRQRPLDWNYILETAEINRTIPVLFRFLHLIHIVSLYSVGSSTIPEEVFNTFQKFSFIRIFRSFLVRDFFGNSVHPKNRIYPYIPSPVLLLITMTYGVIYDVKEHNLSLALERIVKSISHLGRLMLVILGIYNHHEF